MRWAPHIVQQVDQLAELGHIVDGPTDMYVDNKGVIDISQDYLANERTKHIERRHLKIRELVADSIVSVEQVPTRDNVADIFTKAFTRGEKRGPLLRLIGHVDPNARCVVLPPGGGVPDGVDEVVVEQVMVAFPDEHDGGEGGPTRLPLKWE